MTSKQNHNPVQVILNSKNYILDKTNKAVPNNEDFFFKKDSAFIAHKEKLSLQLKSIRDSLNRPSVQPVTYVKVKLRQKAWAKSHRPTKKLFVPRLFPSAGSEGVGEMLFRVANRNMPQLLEQIDAAEIVSKTKPNKETNEPEPDPSRNRTEVGAIEEISIPDEADRRHFSVDDALTWFGDKRSGQFYVVELFSTPDSFAHYTQLSADEQALFQDLVDKLNALSFGIITFKSSVNSAGKTSAAIYLRPVQQERELDIQGLFSSWNASYGELQFDTSEPTHSALLKVLSKHPLVRRITLPPILQGVQRYGQSIKGPGILPVRQEGTKYPRVGIVDAGIHPQFDSWKIGSIGLIDESHRNIEHGSFIAGILVAGRAAGNPPEVAREFDGCEIVDLDIFPSHLVADAFSSYYPNGFEDFLHELDMAIGTAKRKYHTRVFNISLNISVQVNDSHYGVFATLLDAIAEKHDAFIIISAGNLAGKNREVWPSSPSDVAGHLLPLAGQDRILQPAESIMAISVGAINPPGVAGHLAGAPTPYTRRGPGMKVGVKPDFCHYSGTPKIDLLGDEALYSIDGSGHIVSGMGTSYAAPLVAKTLAAIESRIEGQISRETLLALLVHGAKTPQILDHPKLRTIARNFVGFGIPSSSEEILLNDEHSITMLFHSVLTRRKLLTFDFPWPKSLVSPAGKSRGSAYVTLVYKPIVNPAYGAEFVRVNLDAHLRQHVGEGSYEGRTSQIFMKGTKTDAHFEADLIEHGLKWWPVKHYKMNSQVIGKGRHSEWRLVVDSLLREGETFPDEGVPFTVILTITDDKGEKPVFSDMRIWMNANGVNCADIRTAARIRPRG